MRKEKPECATQPGISSSHSQRPIHGGLRSRQGFMKDQGLGPRVYGEDNLRDGSLLKAVDEFGGKGIRFADCLDESINGGGVGAVNLNGALGAVGNGEQGGSAGDIDGRIAGAAIDNPAAGRGLFDSQPAAFERGNKPWRGRSVMGRCGDGSDENKDVVSAAGSSESAGKVNPGMELAGKIKQRGSIFKSVRRDSLPLPVRA